MNRRVFLRAAVGGAALATLPVNAADAKKSFPLAGEIGITTGSFVRHLSPTARAGKLRLLDLPELLRSELDMRVIDLMTATLVSLEPGYCEQLRAAADRAGCVLTNLKMNNPGLELGSADEAKHRHALAEYQRTMDAAARLGVLVENFGWMQGDPDAIPALIKAVGPGLRAQPDTGNWTDAARYDGLAKAFPFAVSCDFKAKELGADGAHAAYDLKRCFQIGWDAGFRGPWCFEHQHADLAQLLKNMARLRDLLRGWMRAAKGTP